MLDISIREHRAHDCVDNLCTAIAYYFNSHHELMFVDSWSFEYEDSTEKIGEGFGIKEVKSLHAIAEMHGIKSQYISDMDESSMRKTISDNLKSGVPVALSMDVFNCEWHTRGFLKYHATHLFFLNGYDEYDDVVHCIDGDQALAGKSMSFRSAFSYIRAIVTFEDHTDSATKFSVETLLSRFIENVKDGTCFDKLDQFVKRFSLEFDVEEETKGFESNFSKSPFYTNLIKVAKSRMKMAIFLKYTCEKLNPINSNAIIACSKDVANYWDSTLGMTFKVYFSKSRESKLFKRIVEKLNLVVQLERNLLYIIQATLSNKLTVYTSEESSNKGVVKFSEVYHVDLLKHVNNIACSNQQNTHNAHYSIDKMYFNEEDVPLDQVVKVGYTSYVIRREPISSKDNISCEGQVIVLPCYDFHSIGILASCELRSHVDEIIIITPNGEKIPIKFEVSNWAMDNPVFNEDVVVTSRTYTNFNEGVVANDFTGKIYSSIYRMPVSTINAIKLPDCPNIHIFGITLCKE